jgi:hypothetical protein
MRRGLAALIGAGACALFVPSLAQAPPSQSPAQSNDWSGETVTVSAHASGPPVWHVTKGAADVAIFGVVEPLPDDYAWNSKPLAKLLDGAKLVLLQPRAQANIFQGVWFLLTERELLHPPDGQTLWNLMSPSLTARFATARDMLHQDKDRYDDDAPAIAALRLEGDFMRVNQMTMQEPEDTIRHLARMHGIKMQRVATYDAMPGAEELLRLPASSTNRCVEAAINDVDIASHHAAAAAESWAIGDVDGIKANWSQPKLYDCLLELSPTVTALDKRATSDTVKQISQALDAGGHSVAVVSIGLLLRKDGVLERLNAAGIPVTGP